mmetsp:Transcript_6731/g.19984  ORF Transcript_6731/g.19984 Transcript_6731/m.19984 type:complete len:2097 (+) Transcript_6731:91-6381(+)
MSSSGGTNPTGNTRGAGAARNGAPRSSNGPQRGRASGRRKQPAVPTGGSKRPASLRGDRGRQQPRQQPTSAAAATADSGIRIERLDIGHAPVTAASGSDAPYTESLSDYSAVAPDADADAMQEAYRRASFKAEEEEARAQAEAAEIEVAKLRDKEKLKRRVNSLRRRSSTNLEMLAVQAVTEGVAEGQDKADALKAAAPAPVRRRPKSQLSADIEEFKFDLRKPDGAALGLSVKETEGGSSTVAVNNLKTGSVAQMAGVLKDDFIVSVDGIDTTSMTKKEVMTVLKSTGAGVELIVARSTKARRLSIRKSRSQQALAASSEAIPESAASKQAGASLSMFSSLQNVNTTTSPNFDEPPILEPNRSVVREPEVASCSEAAPETMVKGAVGVQSPLDHAIESVPQIDVSFIEEAVASPSDPVDDGAKSNGAIGESDESDSDIDLNDIGLLDIPPPPAIEAPPLMPEAIPGPAEPNELHQRPVDGPAAYFVELLRNVKNRVATLSEHNNAGFKREWQHIELVGVDAVASAGSLEANMHKNKHSNVKVYDATRVKLAVVDEDQNSDYINANFVHDHTGGKTYVATQAPIEDTFADFWRMVWELGSNTIVMLTREVEKGQTKCHRYWPDAVADSEGTAAQPQLAYRDIVVCIEATDVCDTHTVRQFSVHYRGQSRTVRQFCFVGWPDEGVPGETGGLLSFQQAVYASDCEGPLIVHCTSGVGRTGVFIALDQLVSLVLDKTAHVSPFDVVSRMREDRIKMVQSLAQFMFLDRLIMDLLCHAIDQGGQLDGYSRPDKVMRLRSYTDMMISQGPPTDAAPLLIDADDGAAQGFPDAVAEGNLETGDVGEVETSLGDAVHGEAGAADADLYNIDVSGLNKALVTWSEDDVALWIDWLGLSAVVDDVHEQHITGSVLLSSVDKVVRALPFKVSFDETFFSRAVQALRKDRHHALDVYHRDTEFAELLDSTADSVLKVDDTGAMRLRVDISDAILGPQQYVTILGHDNDTASELVSRVLTASRQVGLQSRFFRLERILRGESTTLESEDRLGNLAGSVQFVLHRRRQSEDVCTLVIECALLDFEHTEVAIDVRSETTAGEIVALTLMHCRSTMMPETLCLSVDGTRTRRFVDNTENVHNLSTTRFRLHHVSDRSGASRNEIEALKREVNHHREVLKQTRKSLDETESSLEHLQGVRDQHDKLRQEIIEVQGSSASRIAALEHDLDEARAALDREVEKHTEYQAARDAQAEAMDTSVQQLQDEVNRLRHVESRVDVMDAALSEAREHNAVREQQERKLREGMERKYSQRASASKSSAQTDDEHAAALAALQESMAAKEEVIRHYASEYARLNERLFEQQLAAAQYAFQVRMLSNKRKFSDDELSAAEDEHEKLARARREADQAASDAKIRSIEMNAELTSLKAEIGKLKEETVAANAKLQSESAERAVAESPKQGAVSASAPASMQRKRSKRQLPSALPRAASAASTHAELLRLVRGRTIRCKTIAKGEKGIGMSLKFQPGTAKSDPLRGVYIKSLQAASPAHDAGFVSGDQLLEMNGKRMVGLTREEGIAILKSIDSTAHIVYARAGTKDATVVPVSANDLAPQMKKVIEEKSELIAQLEEALQELQAQMRDQPGDGGDNSNEDAMKLKEELVSLQEKCNLLEEQLAAEAASAAAVIATADDDVLTEMERELQLKKEEIAGQSRALDRAKNEGDDLRKEIARMKGELVDFKEQADQLRAEQKASLEAASDKATSSKKRFDSVASGFKAKIKKLQEENAAHAEAREQDKQEAKNQIAELEAKVESLGKIRRKSSVKQDRLIEERDAASAELDKLNGVKGVLESQIAELELKNSELADELADIRQSQRQTASQDREELEKTLELLADERKVAAGQRLAFQEATEVERKKYEAVYHQAVNEAKVRHEQVDAQNDQLRGMIGDLQQKVHELEAKGKENETLHMALQAERDHLQMKMRETVAASVQHRAPKVLSDDEDSDDDAEELKENLKTKTEEARKYKTLVDQIADLVKDKAPELSKDVDNKFQRVMGRGRARTLSLRRSNSLRASIGSSREGRASLSRQGSLQRRRSRHLEAQAAPVATPAIDSDEEM